MRSTYQDDEQTTEYFTPLSQIDDYIKDFTIKVRLIKLTPVKNFTSRRSGRPGKLQNIELIDKFGTVI